MDWNDRLLGQSAREREYLQRGTADKQVLNSFIHDQSWHDGSDISNEIMATHLAGLQAGYQVDSNYDLVYKGNWK
jgi:hypothetical protein